MAFEISFQVQFPDTVEIEIPVSMDGQALGYTTVQRLQEVPNTTKVVEYDDEDRIQFIYWKDGNENTTRLDFYAYVDNYVLETRFATGALPMTIRTNTSTGRSEILEDYSSSESEDAGINLEFIRDTIRNNPGKRIFPVGFEVIVPWTAEDGKVYDYKFVLVDYQYMKVYEDQEGGPVWMGIFRSKYAALHPMQYDAPDQWKRTETTAASGYKYYKIVQTIQSGRIANESTDAANVSTGGTIPSGYIYKYQSSYLPGPIVNGSARYTYSALHKYLNSEAGVGEWWSSSASYDKPPLNADTTQGYLAGFREEDLALFRNVQISWMAASITDASAAQTQVQRYCRFWLPSLTELYCDTGIETEGAAWEEYWQGAGIASPTNNTKDARKVYRIDKDGVAVDYWTRSSNSNVSQYCIGTTGGRTMSPPGRGPVLKGSTYNHYYVVENIEKYLVPVCAVG